MKIKTWAGGGEFKYTGCVAIGTEISYGESSSIKVSAKQYVDLRNTFLGMTVNVSASRDNPQNNSIGEWLQNNVTKTATASYVAPILIREGYAIQETDTEIRIIR